MQRINIIAAGKIKERALAALIAEYEKRLTKYCALKISEVADEDISPRHSEAEVRKALLAEAGRLLGRLRGDEYVIALDMGGEAPDSPQLAGLLNDLAGRRPATAFIIGGSHGLHPQVIERADYVMSMSRLTFPHQLARLILLEQLYRACKINNNEIYHK